MFFLWLYFSALIARAARSDSVLEASVTVFPQLDPSLCTNKTVYHDYSELLKESVSSSTSICPGNSAEDKFEGSGDFDLKVLFTADMHGHVEYFSRIAHIVKAERKRSKNVVLLDCGDISIGTVFARHHGASAIGEIMEQMGYEAMAIGNHDLEYIPELPKKIPQISINTNSSVTKAGENSFLLSKILHVNTHIKLGLVAYTATEELDVNPEDAIERIKGAALCLRKAGVDVVILLGHGMSSLNIDIASRTRGLIDVTLGGHSHELLGCEKGFYTGDVVIHPGAGGEYLGMLQIQRNGDKMSFYSRMIPITQDLPEDPAVVTWLRPKLAELPEESSVIAEVFTPYKEATRACRRRECVSGRIITDAVRAYYGCDVIALFEAGSIRSTLSGNITGHDLINVLPWDNKLVQYSITGRNLQSMLRQSVRSAVKFSGGAFLHVSGLRYADQPGMSDVHGNVRYSVRHGGLIESKVGTGSFNLQNRTCSEEAVVGTIDLERNYTIVVTDWLAGGGDGYSALLSAATRLSEKNLSVIVDVKSIVAQFLSKRHDDTTSSGKERDIKPVFSLRGSDLSILPPLGVAASTKPLPAELPEDIPAHKSPPANSFVQSTIAVLAEIPALLVAHPFRTISTRQQSKKSGGTTGLWDGAFLSIVAVLCSKIIFWTVYYLVLNYFLSLSVVTSALHQGMLSFYASMIGGVVEAVSLHPAWVIVARLQVFGAEAQDLYSNLCDGLGFSVVLVLFPALRQFLFEYMVFMVDMVLLMKSSSLGQGGLGTCATIVATVLTYPLQTLRTQLQTGTLDLATLKPFAGLGAKLLAASVNAFTFFFMKKLLEVLLLRR